MCCKTFLEPTDSGRLRILILAWGDPIGVTLGMCLGRSKNEAKKEAIYGLSNTSPGCNEHLPRIFAPLACASQLGHGDMASATCSFGAFSDAFQLVDKLLDPVIARLRMRRAEMHAVEMI
jgi:hypothetical protein